MALCGHSKSEGDGQVGFIRRYYRGDPGLGSWLKKAARVAFPVASLANSKAGRSIGKGLLPGGGIASGLLSSGGMWQGMSRTDLMNSATSTIAGRIGGAVKQIGGQILSTAARDFATKFTDVQTRPQTGVVVVDPVTGYEYVDYTKKRRGRRMNVTNVKALRRSIRRVKGFAKIARQSLVLEKKVKQPKKRSR